MDLGGPVVTTWEYYWRGGTTRLAGRAQPHHTCDVQTLGASQLAVIMRAREARSGMVMTEGERERLAARRLVERGLLRRGGVPGGNPVHRRCYTLTPRGRHCWIRVRKA
jgi:hypothetical protein